MENVKEFWGLVVDVWNTGVAGIDLGRIIVASFIFIFFLLVRRFFAKIVIRRLRALFKRAESEYDESALNALKRPLSFALVVVGIFFAFKYLSLSGVLDEFADQLIRSLVVLVLFWSLVKLVDPFSQLLSWLEKMLTASLIQWLTKAIKAVFVFIAAATILEIWGVRIAPILAGLGLFGVAVALGAQDLFKNLISGILILAERRFNVGDWIRVEGVVEGTVEAIGFRSTRVKRFDMAPVYVPNAKLSDNSLVNFSGMTYRRIYWNIGVQYRTTVDQLRAIRDQIEEYILGSDDFAKPSEVSTFVRIDRFSDSSIDILVYCFTKSTVWGEWLGVKEKLAFQIKEIVKSAGSGFAFPSQSLYVETLPSERAEVFIPPSDSD